VGYGVPYAAPQFQTYSVAPTVQYAAPQVTYAAAPVYAPPFVAYAAAPQAFYVPSNGQYTPSNGQYTTGVVADYTSPSGYSAPVQYAAPVTYGVAAYGYGAAPVFAPLGRPARHYRSYSGLFGSYVDAW